MTETGDRSGRLFSNVLYLSLGHLVSKGSAVLALAFMARYLGEQDFGQLAFALAASLLFEVTGDFGISQALARDSAIDPSRLRPDAYAAMPVKLVLASISTVIAVAVAAAAGASENLLAVTFFLAVARAFAALTSLLRAVFEGAEHMEYEAVSIALEGVVRLALIMYALLSGFGLLGLAKAYVVAAAIVLLVTFVVALRHFLWPLPKQLAWQQGYRLLRAGLPFAGFWVLGGFSLRANTVLLFSLAGAAATGWFAGAVRLLEPALVIPFIFSVALLPLAARHHSAGLGTTEALFASTQKVVFLSGGLVLVIALAVAPEAIQLVLGPDFMPALASLQILAVGMLSLFAKEGLARMLFAVHRGPALLRSQAVAVVLDIFLFFALVPGLGAAGAALAIALSEGVGVVLAFAALRDLLPSFSLASLLRPLLVVAVAAAGTLLLAPLPLGSRAATAGTLYLAAFLFLRPLSSEEFAYIRSNLGFLEPVITAAGVAASRARRAMR